VNRRRWGCRKGSDRSLKPTFFGGRPFANTLFSENVASSFFGFPFFDGKNDGGLGAHECVDFLEDCTQRGWGGREGSFVCFHILCRCFPSFGHHFDVESRIKQRRLCSGLTLVLYVFYHLSVQRVFVCLGLGVADVLCLLQTGMRGSAD
jgi:hypothetical protein